MAAQKKKCTLQFAVIGLGRFGMSVAKTLAEDYDVDLLVCDKNPARLHEMAAYATQVVQVDALDADAMEKLGIGHFDVVVLGMGEDFESTIMSAMTAKELGAGRVVAKAYNAKQKEILLRIGVDQVVLPESEMGIKVARSLAEPGIMDILERTGRFAVTEMRPLPQWVGKTMREADIRRTFGYTVLAAIRGENTVFPVPADWPLQADDVLITLQEEHDTI